MSKSSPYYRSESRENNESFIFGDVRECILLFENGTQRIISKEQERGQLTVNIVSHSRKENDFVVRVIHNFTYTDTINDLAEKCGFYSTKTFTRHFKTNFRMTPKQWILSVKKEALLECLKNTDNPLKQIAAEMGFSHISHLSDFCLKKTGMRPDEIRRKINMIPDSHIND